MPPALTDREDALARARALLPGFRERIACTEAERTVPEESIAELLSAGLFGILVPQKWGRSELTVEDLIDVAIEISSVCAATGWVYSLLSMHNWWACLFSEEAQVEVFSPACSLVASGVMTGDIERVEGGYVWRNGTARYISGIDHVNWFMAGRRPDGRGGPVGHFLIPRAEVSIVDDWHVLGQKGTGSKTVRVEEAFVPEHRFAARDPLMEGQSAGSRVHSNRLYHRPLHSVMPLALVSPSVGIARAGIEAYRAAVTRKFANASPEQLADQSAVFYNLSQASVEVDAAYALLQADARRLGAMADPAEFTPLETARLRRDVSFVGQTCRRAVNRLFEVSGASALFESGDLQRIFRDINAAAAHGGLAWDTAGLFYGRIASGVAPSAFDRSGRPIAYLPGLT